jgi:hypothetical protein
MLTMRLYDQTESAPRELKLENPHTHVGRWDRKKHEATDAHLDGHDHGANGPETVLAKRLLHSRVAAESPWIVRNFEQQCRRG